MGPALRSWGVRCLEGFDPAHLDPRPDLVIIGNVCRRDNPLARAAIDGGLRYTDMAHALAEHVLEGRAPLVVAGTHGKTTTTAMAAWLLHDTGREPGFLIGGLPKNFDRSFALGSARRRLPSSGESVLGANRAPPFVLEGDEYDTAPRSPSSPPSSTTTSTSMRAKRTTSRPLRASSSGCPPTV
jgi:UDP-N-acetylmuramate: L-alanyl-gamma-D-glutamyl-meso-diaminopimelate ligase